MENSQLARDIVADLDRKSYDVDSVASHVTDDTLTTFVQTILDKLENFGYDFSNYETDDDDDDDDFDDDEELYDDDEESYDDDDDEVNESDSTPRNDGGYWTDPNDPTA